MVSCIRDVEAVMEKQMELEERITKLERRLGELEAVLASWIAPVGDETYADTDEDA